MKTALLFCHDNKEHIGNAMNLIVNYVVLTGVSESEKLKLGKIVNDGDNEELDKILFLSTGDADLLENIVDSIDPIITDYIPSNAAEAEKKALELLVSNKEFVEWLSYVSDYYDEDDEDFEDDEDVSKEDWNPNEFFTSKRRGKKHFLSATLEDRIAYLHNFVKHNSSVELNFHFRELDTNKVLSFKNTQR